MQVEKTEYLGCYKDYPDRAIPLLEATSPLLDGSYMQREAAIRRCAKAAYDLQFDIFAVQNGGQCKGGIRPHLNYKKYGKSTQCQGNGPGGPWENQVSKISSKKWNKKNVRSDSVASFYLSNAIHFPDSVTC